MSRIIVNQTLLPARKAAGEIDLPGDKSISHRAAIVAALANGTSVIHGFSQAADCRSTLECLSSLGCVIEQASSTVRITGKGLYGLNAPERALDCGNSGTTMRLLAGVLAGQRFDARLTGDDSLVRRPMMRVVKPLELMGAQIDSHGGYAPLEIRGSFAGLKPIQYTLPLPSAQVKSCLLLAGLYADGVSTVEETTPTRDHTERMLAHFGCEIDKREGKAHIVGRREFPAKDIWIPGDASAGIFFAVAAAMLPGSRVTLKRMGVNPSRMAAFELLRRAGLSIELANGNEQSNEPVADVLVKFSTLSKQTVRIEGGDAALLIDELPALAILGTQLEGGLEVRGAGELRVKESDRITAIVQNLTKMDAAVEEFDDGFRVSRSKLRGARIDSLGDHRIAMAFAIAALTADGPSEITDSGCVDISFPQFFETLMSVVM